MSEEAYELDEAIDALQNHTGQTYLTSREAFRILAPFADEVVDAFIVENIEYATEEEPDGDAMVALAESLADTQRLSRDTRGIVNTWPFQPLVTHSDVSAIIVEAMGGEPSDYTAGGAGFTADGRHDRNVGTIDELLDRGTAEA